MKKEELEQFILKYGETLMKFCKITTNDSELAWELYQDTMLRLVEHYKKLDMSENVKAWAISTAINLWKNRKRKYAWRKRIAKKESYEVHMENEFQSFACCCSLGYILYNPARADVQGTVDGRQLYFNFYTEVAYVGSFSMGGIFYGNLSVIFFDDTFNNGKTQSVLSAVSAV